MSTEYLLSDSSTHGGIYAAEASTKLCLVYDSVDNVKPITPYLTATEMAQVAVKLLQACGYSMDQKEWDDVVKQVNALIT